MTLSQTEPEDHSMHPDRHQGLWRQHIIAQGQQLIESRLESQQGPVEAEMEQAQGEKEMQKLDLLVGTLNT